MGKNDLNFLYFTLKWLTGAKHAQTHPKLRVGIFGFDVGVRVAATVKLLSTQSKFSSLLQHCTTTNDVKFGQPQSIVGSYTDFIVPWWFAREDNPIT